MQKCILDHSKKIHLRTGILRTDTYKNRLPAGTLLLHQYWLGHESCWNICKWKVGKSLIHSLVLLKIKRLNLHTWILIIGKFYWDIWHYRQLWNMIRVINFVYRHPLSVLCNSFEVLRWIGADHLRALSLCKIMTDLLMPSWSQFFCLFV